MHITLKTVALSALLFGSACAQAAVYKLDFSAAGFGPGIFSNGASPQAVVGGSITFSAPVLGAPATAIDALDLTIGGHRYSVGEVGFGTYGDGYVFGATINGVGVNRAGDNDFYLILSSGLNVFSYAQAGIFDTWVTRGVTANFTPQAATDVPEPATLATALAGLGALCLLRRRRRPRQTRAPGCAGVNSLSSMNSLNNLNSRHAAA